VVGGLPADEVLTGEFLFFEQDWTSFYLRLTQTDRPLLTPDKLAALPDVLGMRPEHGPPLLAFLQWVLQRDVTKRPSISEIAHRFAQLHESLISGGGVSSDPDEAPAPAPAPAAKPDRRLVPIKRSPGRVMCSEARGAAMGGCTM